MAAEARFYCTSQTHVMFNVKKQGTFVLKSEKQNIIEFGHGQQWIKSSTAPREDNFDCCSERYGIVEYYLPIDEQKPLNGYFGKQ